jgi:hypothetical protein
MNKIEFRFTGFELTSQGHGTHNLLLIVVGDIEASIVHGVITAGIVSVRYKEYKSYFDLLIAINDSEYYELNFVSGIYTNALRQAIDLETITALWVVYPVLKSLVSYGLEIKLRSS